MSETNANPSTKSTNNIVSEFNTYLSINLSNLSLKDYFIKFHDKFNKDSNFVDISFMDYFLYLCNHKDEFVVEHEKLVEYGVLNTIKDSNKVNRMLSQFDLVENEDFLLDNVVEQDKKTRRKQL